MHQGKGLYGWMVVVVVVVVIEDEEFTGMSIQCICFFVFEVLCFFTFNEILCIFHLKIIRRPNASKQGVGWLVGW